VTLAVAATAVGFGVVGASPGASNAAFSGLAMSKPESARLTPGLTSGLSFGLTPGLASGLASGRRGTTNIVGAVTGSPYDQHRSSSSQRSSSRAATIARPYLIYDSVTPTAIPAHEQIATYANGLYAASSAAVRGRGNVLWIDTNGSDPSASALDVEPGDATPIGAAQWVKKKLSTQPRSLAIVYTTPSEWQEVRDAANVLPATMRSKIRYWIADPTGAPHVVPGASATQWSWGSSYDITTADPGF